MNNLTVLFFVLANLLVQTVFAQKAYLQSDTITEGDVAVLHVEYSDDTPSMCALDTSPLDPFFKVLSVKPKVERKHENNRIINVMHWEVVLSPKIKGLIKIPSLTIKQSSTPELTLEVIDSVPDGNERIGIEVTASPENPFIGERTLVTIRLVSNRLLLSGFLRDPKLTQASVINLGIDQAYEQTINGESFHILQRKIAVFAHRSGAWVFPPVQFLGEIDALNVNGLPRQILRRSDPLTVTVLDPPSTYTGNRWLPLTELEISEQWNGLDQNLKVGDSISRTISLRATGLAADELPNNLFRSDSDKLVVYADKAKTDNDIIDGNIVGRLDQAFAIVLTEQGRLYIPEVRLDWWDVDDDRQKQVTLPAITMMIAAATSSPTNGTAQSGQSMRWLAGIVAFLLLMLMLYRLYLERDSASRFSKKQFKQACLTGDADQARALLIVWAREQWTDESIVGLSGLKNKTGSGEFKFMLEKLDSAIYAPHQPRWQGRQLWQAFADLKRLKKPPGNNQPASQQGLLPSLYPSE